MQKFILTISLGVLLICQTGLAIEFQKSIDAARKQDMQSRPMVVSFGAPWCGWCRKMEADTFDSAEVKAITDKYLWVKIDVDEEVELAARYHVEGLPRTIVLDAKGRVIGSAEGYLPPARFVKFLDESLTKPLPDEYRVDELLQELAAAKDDEATRKSVTALLDIACKADRLARDEILSALKQHKARTASVLLELMSSERLAVRAAAAGCLKHCLQTDLRFDPFAEKVDRDAQLIECRKVLEAKIVKSEIRRPA